MVLLRLREDLVEIVQSDLRFTIRNGLSGKFFKTCWLTHKSLRAKVAAVYGDNLSDICRTNGCSGNMETWRLGLLADKRQRGSVPVNVGAS